MVLHLARLARVELVDRVHEFPQVARRYRVGQRVVARRHDALSRQHLEPADFGEQLLMLADDVPVAAPQVDLRGERVGDGHVAALAPERRVVARCRLVMEDDEVADAFVFEVALAVELGADRRRR